MTTLEAVSLLCFFGWLAAGIMLFENAHMRHEKTRVEREWMRTEREAWIASLTEAADRMEDRPCPKN